jgi:hypothetical protein
VVVIPGCCYMLYRNSLDAGFVWDDRAAIVSVHIFLY